MTALSTRRAISVGEAMLEMASAGPGLYRQGFAGDTFNTIWHMAQLLGSGHACGFVTRVGTDSFSDRFVAEMQSDGLETDGVSRDAERRMALYLIELQDAERSFHYWRGESAARGLADDPAALSHAFAGAGLVHLSGITLAILSPDGRARLLDVVRQARQGGAIVSFDPNVRPRLWASPEACRTALADMLAITDIALPSFDDEAALWGDESPQHTLARMAAMGVGEVAVKDGPGPVHAGFGGHSIHRPTPPVADIRDTTGAGDAFNAGYLAARLLGAGPAAAIDLGQQLSARVIQTHGARAPAEAVRQLGLAFKP